MNSKEISGMVITIIGALLLAYAFIVGGLHGHIGSETSITGDAWAALLGMFLVIIGPALWFGEVPTVFREKVERPSSSQKEG